MDDGLSSYIHVLHPPGRYSYTIEWSIIYIYTLLFNTRPFTINLFIWNFHTSFVFAGLTLEISSVTILYGQSGALTCTGTKGSDISWTTNGSAISSGSDYTVTSDSNVSTLDIKKLEVDTEFECVEGSDSDSTTARVAGKLQQ